MGDILIRILRLWWYLDECLMTGPGVQDGSYVTAQYCHSGVPSRFHDFTPWSRLYIRLLTSLMYHSIFYVHS